MQNEVLGCCMNIQNEVGYTRLLAEYMSEALGCWLNI